MGDIVMSGDFTPLLWVNFYQYELTSYGHLIISMDMLIYPYLLLLIPSPTSSTTTLSMDGERIDVVVWPQ